MSENDFARRVSKIMALAEARERENRELGRLAKLQSATDEHPEDFSRAVERRITEALLAQSIERREADEAALDPDTQALLNRLDSDCQ